MVFGILIVPLVILILKTGAGHLSWVPPLQPDSLLILGVDFSGLYGRMLLIPDVLAIGIAALGASRVQSGSGPTGDAWGYALFFPWLVAPVEMVVTVSLVKPIFVPRFLIFCLPALLLLVAVGLCRLRPAALSVGLIVAISVCSILADIRGYQYDFDMSRQDWRAVTSYVFDHAQPGDSIFFYPAAGEALFNYYGGQQKSASLKPKTLNERWLKTRNGQNPFDPKPEDWVAVPGTNLRATLPLGSRAWLVLMILNDGKQEVDTGKAVGNWLSNGRQEVDAPDFMPLKVILFDRNAASSLPVGSRESAKR